MKNKTKIDDLFKKELGSYTEAPPPAVWDALEKKLDHIPVVMPSTPYRWLGYFAMISASILIGVFAIRSISGGSNQAIKNIVTNNISGIQNSTAGGNTTGNTATTANGTQLNMPDNKDNAANNTPDNNDQQAGSAANRNRQTNKQKSTAKATDNQKNNKNTYAKNATRNSNNQPGNTVNKTETEQPQNIYNSSAPKTETTPEDPAEQQNKKVDSLATDKKNSVDSSKKKVVAAPPKKAPKPKFTRFEAGVKGGYESGFDNDAAKKIIVSPYLQYKLTPKLAIMLQPAIKYANVGSKIVGEPNTYYKVNPGGTLTQKTDSLPVYPEGSPNEPYWIWNSSYTETHDSIVKKYVTGATYAEFEEPVLLKYYITKGFSVYGGVNMTYSKLAGLTEQTYTSGPISRTVEETVLWRAYNPLPVQPLASTIKYSGADITTYTGPEYPAPRGSLLRFGYMLGFSYEFHRNWLFDGLIEQSPVAPNVQGGYNVNTPISAPYFRLTIGYKLIK